MALFWGAAPRVPSPLLDLQPGQSYVPPQGWYWFQGDRASSLQTFDPIAQVWRSTGDGSSAMRYVYFDGQASRIANPTGCPVGAVVTDAGSGYATAPTVTASAGNSTWNAILGGAISTSVSILAAGSGYAYPPVLWIEAPPQPGVQATGTVQISGGAVGTVTIDNQGAGYINPPVAVLINDPRDTTGSGGQVTLGLTGSGTVTALVCTNPGQPVSAVPTLSFSAGAAAATAVMDWTINAVAVNTAGAGYTSAAGSVTASGAGGYVTATPTYAGGATSTGLQRWREAKIDVATSSTGALTSAFIIDGGRYQGVPTPTITSEQTPTTAGALGFTMGGVVSTVFLMPAQL